MLMNMNDERLLGRLSIAASASISARWVRLWLFWHGCEFPAAHLVWLYYFPYRASPDSVLPTASLITLAKRLRKNARVSAEWFQAKANPVHPHVSREKIDNIVAGTLNPSYCPPEP